MKRPVRFPGRNKGWLLLVMLLIIEMLYPCINIQAKEPESELVLRVASLKWMDYGNRQGRQPSRCSSGLSEWDSQIYRMEIWIYSYGQWKYDRQIPGGRIWSDGGHLLQKRVWKVFLPIQIIIRATPNQCFWRAGTIWALRPMTWKVLKERQ